jgi:hypothetical protein
MELDCITGEITYSEPTAEQVKQQKLDKAEQAAQAKVEADKAKAKADVIAKLGLTADEVSALLS